MFPQSGKEIFKFIKRKNAGEEIENLTLLTASRRKQSEQETLASDNSRPSSSKASNMKTSKPGQFLSENTFIMNPFSRVSTVTCKVKLNNLSIVLNGLHYI